MVVAAVLFMIALSFASVPLYRLFCQVTGFGGTPGINPGARAERVLDRPITIRFNSDTARDMPWEFAPEEKSVTLNIGQKGFISFQAKNTSKQVIEGTAIYNVLPLAAGEYFQKTQCFCFGRQVLNPGEETQMPVAFFIDPDIVNDPTLKDIQEITLSYTFFKADSAAYDEAVADFIEE